MYRFWKVIGTSILIIYCVLIYPSTIIAQVVVNEIYPNAPNPDGRSEPDEFIEIYNYGDNEIDITGYTISDSSNSYSLSQTIKPKEFLVFLGSATGIRLSNSGEEVYFKDKSGNELHPAINYGNFSDKKYESKSWSRSPDGTGEFILADVTKGSVNYNPPADTPVPTETSVPTITNTPIPIPTVEVSNSKRGVEGISDINSENIPSVKPGELLETQTNDKEDKVDSNKKHSYLFFVAGGVFFLAAAGHSFFKRKNNG